MSTISAHQMMLILFHEYKENTRILRMKMEPNEYKKINLCNRFDQHRWKSALLIKIYKNLNKPKYKFVIKCTKLTHKIKKCVNWKKEKEKGKEVPGDTWA